ncbi:CXADR-like membrane protein isoform X2 [Anguilla rostrata]|uniref:CXADR-like membrane protein isoform X2 n=1 Tax=Anguilla rostrata TaxID=7938 RepID=UPI0030D380B9
MPPLYAVLVLFSKVYGLLANIFQPDALVKAQLGDTVTLPCFYTAQERLDISWFKQPLGLKPQLIVVHIYYQSDPTFFNEFKNSKRLSAKAAMGSFNLTVSQMEPSDSATYYCTVRLYSEISFGNGTTLMVMVKGSESHSRAIVLQPKSQSVQPGDSVTLQCTVRTETCAGEHSVYWFRQGSGESPPGIIYTHGNRSDECQRSSGAVSPSQNCTYNFPKRNLSPSDAGTYYCAVATCGEILFGNGTKLNVEGAASNNQVSGENLMSKQSQEESMNYAALTFTTKKPKVRRNKREVEKETVYSDMRFRDRE